AILVWPRRAAPAARRAPAAQRPPGRLAGLLSRRPAVAAGAAAALIVLIAAGASLSRQGLAQLYRSRAQSELARDPAGALAGVDRSLEIDDDSPQIRARPCAEAAGSGYLHLMRAVGYSRCLLCSALAVLMLTLMLAALPAVSFALEPGVHADPGSPAEKQYVLPLSQARGTGGESSSHSSSPRLFGAGIKPPRGGGSTGGGPPSGTQAGSGAARGKGNDRHRNGAGGVRASGAPAGAAAPL